MVKVSGVMLNCLKNQWREWELGMHSSFTGMFFSYQLGSFCSYNIYRLVRAHWDPIRMEAIKDAYKRRYGKTLEGRVKGETSGD